jgi:indolepyruvate ferredoxin oxidoreductase beta subunit
MSTDEVVNVVVAGLGGQGVVKASDILADAAFRAGFDVKKSELHGMSQRGGSVSSDVRFGGCVLSPMVPAGEADFLVILSSDQVEPNRHVLRDGGTLIVPEQIDAEKLANRKSLNVALLGSLSRHLPVPVEHWHAALRAHLAEKLHEANLQAFDLGRAA